MKKLFILMLLMPIVLNAQKKVKKNIPVQKKLRLQSLWLLKKRKDL